MGSWQRYIDDGTRAVELHPDYPYGIDFETAAKDMIGNILHAAEANYEKLDERDQFDARLLLDAALVGYYGDFEDKP